jgi:hypothetical protein
MEMSSRRIGRLAGVLIVLSAGAIWLDIKFMRSMDGGWMWLSLLATLVFGLTWIASALVGATSFRTQRRAVAVLAGALLLTAGGLYQATTVGIYLRDRDFEACRPSMERAIARLHSMPDSLLGWLDPERVVPEHRERFYVIRAYRPAPGQLSVWFFYGGLALPPRHAAWLYESDSTVTVVAARGDFWHRMRPLRPHWFDASD